MRTVLERLLAAADLVIFDSPPLQAVTDAAVLSSFVDGTILVIDARRSRRRTVRNARESLTRAGANVLGAVLNRARAASPSEYGGYYDARKSAEVPVAAPDAASEVTGTSRHLPRTG